MQVNRLSKIITLITIVLVPFYFLRFDVFGIPTNILEIAVLISLLSTFYFLLSTKRPWRFGQVWPYLITITAALGIFFTNDLENALGWFKGYFLVPLVLYFVIINIFDKKEARQLSIPIYISTMLVGLWAILQKLGIITVLFYQRGDASFAQYLEEHIRVFGPFESPNYLAMFLVPMIFLSIPFITLIKDKYLQAAAAVGLILPFVALLFSGSRAGMIALLVCAVLAFTIRIKRSFQVSNLLISALAIVSVIALAYYFVIMQFNTNSDTVRLEIYRYSIEIIRNNWIWGVGLGGFRETIVNATANAEGFKTFALPYALHPHNIFLAFWLNMGLAGIIAFLINIVVFVYRFLADKKKELLYLCAFLVMAAILVHGMFDTTYFKNDLSAIFFLELAVGIIYSHEKSSK
jgi:O-antigen ligase